MPFRYDDLKGLKVGEFIGFRTERGISFGTVAMVTDTCLSLHHDRNGSDAGLDLYPLDAIINIFTGAIAEASRSLSDCHEAEQTFNGEIKRLVEQKKNRQEIGDDT